MCDVALGAVAAAHCRSGAVATALLCSQPSSSAAAESKDKGKATTAPPVDYIGLSTDGSSLLFCTSGKPHAARGGLPIPRRGQPVLTLLAAASLAYASPCLGIVLTVAAVGCSGGRGARAAHPTVHSAHRRAGKGLHAPLLRGLPPILAVHS